MAVKLLLVVALAAGMSGLVIDSRIVTFVLLLRYELGSTRGTSFLRHAASLATFAFADSDATAATSAAIPVDAEAP